MRQYQSMYKNKNKRLRRRGRGMAVLGGRVGRRRGGWMSALMSMLPAAWSVGKKIFKTGKKIYNSSPELQRVAKKGKQWAMSKLEPQRQQEEETGEGIRRRKKGRGIKRRRRRAMGVTPVSGPLA